MPAFIYTPFLGSSERGVRRNLEYEKEASMRVHTRQPFNAGPTLAQLRSSFITPPERFFVRNHAPVPVVDEDSWRLAITGRVARPLRLRLAELQRDFRRRELVATLQCAGNRRDEMLNEAQLGASVAWGSEAVGNAIWQGVRLADLLAVAGPEKDAAHVWALGLDECQEGERPEGFGGSIPLAKAMEAEVLLAWAMNGQPLPPVHGGPLRLVVPGYIGARSVKWLTRLTLSASPSRNHFQARSYKVFPPKERAASVDWERGESLGPLWVNAVICHPAAGDTLRAGPIRVAGYAQGGAPIVAVELSTDGGRVWRNANLSAEKAPWAWRFWEATVPLPRGEHELVVRARDERGEEQPPELAPIWNFKGYRVNHWQRRRITIE